jgi:hypothetical protein
VKFAYADPPYLGQGAKLYGDLHAEAADCDTLEWHAQLLERLSQEYPDGWALSASSPSLRHILPMCPEDCRVGAWVKPFCAWKPNSNPAYAWEPVIFRGGRKRTWRKDRSRETVRDYISAPMMMRKGFVGAKPPQFVRWIIEVLGVEPQDRFDDLFPGSGAVAEALQAWREAASGACQAPLFEDAC